MRKKGGPEFECLCNNPQGTKLRRFKNRTSARFEYIYCTLFPLCHSNQDVYPFLKDASFCSCFCAYDCSVLWNIKIFTHLLPNFSYKDLRLTEVTYHCINLNDRVINVQKKNYLNVQNVSDPIVEVNENNGNKVQ